MPTMEQLGLPPIVRKLCDYHQGMILVTGSTGTGKSTTLASMIDYLNSTRSLNIISLEDPIEFVHRSKTSQVIQRELGTHLPSFAEGVRAAMREDPDVILVGELRDAETISMAMTAAETGHLVLGTLHTTSATKTIDRIIDALPTEEREQTKSFLAQSLIAVITQVLIKSPDQRARRADMRSHGAHQGHRQAHHDRSVAPDSEPAANGQGIWHAADGSGIARGHQRQGSRSRARLQLRERQAPIPAFRHRFGGRCPHPNPPPLRDPEVPAIDSFLNQVMERNGSDLHFLAGDPPRVRQYGELKALSNEPLGAEMVKTTLYEIMPKLSVERFEAKDGTDFAYSMPNVARFRVNVMRQLNGMGAVFRVIPSKAKYGGRAETCPKP